MENVREVDDLSLDRIDRILRIGKKR